MLASADPLDPTTTELQRPTDYTSFLDREGLKGARIGVPSDPSDPANDFYYSALSQRAAAVMRETIAVLEREGATVVRANIPTEGWIGGPGTEMAILNRNPESATRNQPARRPIVFVYELKHDLNLYLRDWAAGSGITSLADIIAFNAEHADRALRFGQDIFLAAEATRGDLSELEYLSARQMDLRASRTLGLDAYIDRHRLDAVLFPGAAGASNRRQGGLSQRSGTRRLRLRGPRKGDARLSVRRHLHRPRLERADPAPPRLRLRAGDQSSSTSAQPASARPRLPALTRPSSMRG
jgi:amidase